MSSQDLLRKGRWLTAVLGKCEGAERTVRLSCEPRFTLKLESEEHDRISEQKEEK